MHADALICSHPRSGGRWLRYLVAHYLAARHELGVAVTPPTVFAVVPDHHDERTRGYPALQIGERCDVPLVAVCHQPYSWEAHRGYPVVFLARNAYDVMVSAYAHLTQQKKAYAGSMREFIRHPVFGLPSWIQYMNAWAPKLLTHRDSVLLSYRELDADPGRALEKVLEFIQEEPVPDAVREAVESGNALRRGRGIRTGQEGNFWDHLQPDEIFDIQEALYTDLTDLARHLLDSAWIEIDPFPREDA